MANNESGEQLFISNMLAHKTLVACEEILGNGGVHSVLNQANLHNLIENYPPDNADKEFLFSDYAAMMIALEEVYGKRGGKIMGVRIGRAVSKLMIDNFGIMIGATNVAFKVLPLHVKMRLMLMALSKILGKVTDFVPVVEEHEDSYDFIVKRCPVCWGRHDEEEPVCYNDIGLLQGLMHWVSNGKEFAIVETKCHAAGDDSCTFRVFKEPVDA